ncbi:hypothetical protein DENSPDRAFT_886213 [Dentipellis sp. KUC8613]|nr:hypothetical protein DENSPDRAFT_886213 [Dentipellis sp. KUC8613]
MHTQTQTPKKKARTKDSRGGAAQGAMIGEFFVLSFSSSLVAALSRPLCPLSRPPLSSSRTSPCLARVPPSRGTTLSPLLFAPSSARCPCPHTALSHRHAAVSSLCTVLFRSPSRPPPSLAHMPPFRTLATSCGLRAVSLPRHVATRARHLIAPPVVWQPHLPCRGPARPSNGAGCALPALSQPHSSSGTPSASSCTPRHAISTVVPPSRPPSRPLIACRAPSRPPAPHPRGLAPQRRPFEPQHRPFEPSRRSLGPCSTLLRPNTTFARPCATARPFRARWPRVPPPPSLTHSRTPSASPSRTSTVLSRAPARPRTAARGPRSPPFRAPAPTLAPGHALSRALPRCSHVPPSHTLALRHVRPRHRLATSGQCLMAPCYRHATLRRRHGPPRRAPHRHLNAAVPRPCADALRLAAPSHVLVLPPRAPAPPHPAPSRSPSSAPSPSPARPLRALSLVVAHPLTRHLSCTDACALACVPPLPCFTPARPHFAPAPSAPSHCHPAAPCAAVARRHRPSPSHPTDTLCRDIDTLNALWHPRNVTPRNSDALWCPAGRHHVPSGRRLVARGPAWPSRTFALPLRTPTNLPLAGPLLTSHVTLC